MKRKRFLSVLVIGALVSTMTLVTSNPVKASDSTDITVKLTGNGDGSSWTYSNGYADASMDHKLNLGKNGNIPTKTDYDEEAYWDRGTKGGTNAIDMSGGKLTITGFDNSHNNKTTGKITATGGNIVLSDNYLTISGDSSISEAVILETASGSYLNVTGGSVAINSGDTINGTVNASSGSLTVSGGDHTLNSSSVIGSGVNFAVTGGTLRFANASTLQNDFTNAGTLWFNGGTQDDNITNTANTTIHFVGTSNSGQVTGGTENVVFTNSSSVTSESNSGTIAAKNLYVGETSTNVGNFTNNGTISTTADVGVREGSSFTNNSGKSLTIGGSLKTASGASTTIENANNITFSSTSGKYDNDGSLTFKGGTISNAVSGNGSTDIKGNVTNNSTITQSTGGIKISSGSLTTNASNVSGTVTNNVADGYILTNGTNNNTITKSGTTGSTKIAAGTNTVINTANINQDVHVATGTLNNSTGGSVTGLTTIDSNGTLNNTAGTLANVTNNGTLSVSGGQTGAVTNNNIMTVSGTNDNGVGAVTNDGKLTISGGKIASVTNNTSGNNGTSQTAGTVTTVNNSNTGTYTLSGSGAITGTTTNSGTFNLKNSGVSDFKQDSGTLNITSDGSLTLTSTTNTITGGTVNLGDATSVGTLNINNGLNTNTAKVVTTGASVLNVQNGTLTTATDTNIGNGAAVTIGTASDTTGTLNVTNGTVALGTNDNWNAKGEVNVNGGTLNLNGVTQNGKLAQTTGNGTTNVLSNQTLGTDTTITNGTLNIGDGAGTNDTTLTVTGGTITAGSGNAKVVIDSDSIMDIKGGTVTLDGGSGTHGQVDWQGTVKLENGGSLILSNIYDTSRTTAETKNKTGILNAEGGNLTINSSTVLLGNNDVIAKAVNLTLAGDIVVDSSANAYIDNSDNWTVGNITQTGGTLSLDGVSTDDGKVLNSNGGTLNVLNTTTLATGSDYIKENTVINLASGNTLAINNSTATAATDGVTFDNGDTTVPRAADSWLGNITQSGGLLTFKNRRGTAADSTDSTKTLNITGGKLVLNNSSLTLNKGSKITNAIVSIDPSDLIFNNAEDNSATILMEVDDGSTLTIQGGDTSVDPAKYTTLTLLADSNLDYGTVTVGDGTNANVLNIYNNADIAGDVIFKVLDKATANVAGTSNLVINGTGTNADVWNGTINQTAGTITFLDDIVKDATTAKLTSDGGNIIVGYVDTADAANNKAGTLSLNNANDSITTTTAVTINSNGTLKQSAGTVVLDNTNDTWDGAIELSGTGDLTLSGRPDTTTATKTFNQSGGKLTIDNGGSLTLNTADSKIDGTSEVVLGKAGATSADDTAGTLIVNNGSANQAKVTTAGTNTSNAFSVTGANTAFTTLTGTDFEVGSVTVGDGDKASVLNLSNNGIIADAVTLTVAKASKLNVDGATAQATINSGDTWNGAIEQSAGTVTHLDNVVKDENDATYKVTGGNVKIGDGTTAGTLTLNNAADSIAKAANVTIYDDSKLAQSAGTVLLDNTTDTWDGAIELSDIGNLTLEEFTKTTDGTLTYNQTGGKATLDNTSLELAYDATNPSFISDGSVELTNGSTLTVSNALATNKAAVTMAAAGETLNVKNGSTMTLDHYTYDPSGADQLIQTSVTAGAVNVGDSADNTDHSTLEVASGTIAQATAVTINEGSALNITGAGAEKESAPGAGDAIAATITLDGSDNWNGDINLSNASGGSADDKDISLTLTGVTKTTGANPTFDNTGSAPYYSQTGGSLALTNNTTLSMADSSLISGGDLTVDTNSTFNSLSNAFSVTNLTNAGLINGINGGYENYAVSTGFYAGDALSGDKQGDFTTDLYARCSENSNFKYDTYGSDSATIYASDPSKHGILNVSDWTLNGDIYGWDAPVDSSYNLDKLFKGSVAAGHTIDFTSTNKEVFTPIGWYGLHSRGGGNYTFDLNRYNPGVFRGQVTTIAQYQNQLMIDDMLFNHTMLDQGFKGNDYIASNPNRLASATDLYPPYQYSRKDGGVWVKMYGTFEKLNMNHGLNVGNNAYGTLIGVDFGLKDLKRGWQFMPTAYIGYNGAHQYWNGYGAYQNGGQAGVMGTWYKNNLMIGALAYGGVYGNSMSTPRGDDDTFNYFAGGSVKTAYNWRFAKDWSLQPNLLLAYNFFGQQNWHSDFGQMGMMSGMLNGINIAPGLNLIWEKETFSIYATLQYMYNVNQSTGGRAGHVNLPHVHMDRGYIQYGIGINKKFTDRFSGFLQAVIRNVGRNGIGLQAGFQWQFGKGGSNDKIQKGNVTPELKKTEITLNGNKVQ